MNILVTGCSRGVGLEICSVLLREGHTVYGVARSYTDEFKALEQQYNGKLFFKSIDLSVFDLPKIICETFHKLFQHITSLHIMPYNVC